MRYINLHFTYLLYLLTTTTLTGAYNDGLDWLVVVVSGLYDVRPTEQHVSWMLLDMKCCHNVGVSRMMLSNRSFCHGNTFTCHTHEITCTVFRASSSSHGNTFTCHTHEITCTVFRASSSSSHGWTLSPATHTRSHARCSVLVVVVVTVELRMKMFDSWLGHYQVVTTRMDDCVPCQMPPWISHLQLWIYNCYMYACKLQTYCVLWST